MTITKKINGTEVVLSLQGILNVSSVKQLDTELESCIDTATRLVFDMEELEYVSSAGLRTLLAAQKKMTGKGTLILRHPNSVVMETLTMTGFSKIMTIE